MSFVHTVTNRLQKVLGGAAPLHQPEFAGTEWKYVKDCLDSGWVSSVGDYVDSFEKQLAVFTGVKHGVATVNGTSALHLGLRLLDIGPGDEVLLPALTFVATANAVHYCGATPHFVDSEMKSFGVDPGKLADYLADIAMIKGSICLNTRTGRPIRGLIVMHTFGHPVDLDPVLEVCRRFKLELIEDAAEALGSLYKGRHVGGWGKLSILSFNGNKIITTGGGGAILTNDTALAKAAKHLSTTAKIRHPWAYYHDQVGYNYRLPNINAALGLAQLERMPEFIENKRALAQKYHQAFLDVQGVSFVTEPEHTKSNYWLNSLLLAKENAWQRDKLLEMTNQVGICTRPPWVLMNKLPMYSSCPAMDLKTAQEIEGRVVNIPSSAYLGRD